MRTGRRHDDRFLVSSVFESHRLGGKSGLSPADKEKPAFSPDFEHNGFRFLILAGFALKGDYPIFHILKSFARIRKGQ